ncbi:MAG: hypothetical protein ACOYKQ_00235 [Polymorphobacter sp.]
MIGARIWASLQARAAARAETAVGVAKLALAARAAGLPGVTVSIADDVRLHGHDLVARAFGSRRGTADPRLRALIATDLGQGDPP